MFGKKGFIKTLEAIISIVLLLGLVLFIFSGNSNILKRTPQVVESTNTFVINEFLNNETFRNCFINTNSNLCTEIDFFTTSENRKCGEVIGDFLLKSAPTGYDNKCEVCISSKSCTDLNIPVDKSVYTRSGFIYSEKEKEGRIIRNYIFEK
ncbi:hypothetical protein HYX16_06825 [Candidatus Woesearchaeota archaeon]|nr:hypothetical protein [Candidatus Woesearchaeota archaeon]